MSGARFLLTLKAFKVKTMLLIFECFFFIKYSSTTVQLYSFVFKYHRIAHNRYHLKTTYVDTKII